MSPNRVRVWLLWPRYGLSHPGSQHAQVVHRPDRHAPPPGADARRGVVHAGAGVIGHRVRAGDALAETAFARPVLHLYGLEAAEPDRAGHGAEEAGGHAEDRLPDR